MAIELGGIYIPLITPFAAGGRLDEACLRRLIDHYLAEGVAGFVPCGTTGESPTLTHEEHHRVIRITVEQTAGQRPVIAGAGTNSTAKTLELVAAAEEAGADGLLLVSPYYNKPTQAGLLAHFHRVAEATRLPIVLYNIPGRTAVRMEVPTIVELSQVPNIIGLKEASGDINHAMEILASVSEDFTVLCGEDHLTFLMCCLGARGAIAAAAHVATRDWIRLVDLVRAGRVAEAREIHYRLLPLTRALFMETNPMPAKAALNILGMSVGEPRLPLVPASEACKERLKKELARVGLLEPAIA